MQALFFFISFVALAASLFGLYRTSDAERTANGAFETVYRLNLRIAALEAAAKPRRKTPGKKPS